MTNPRTEQQAPAAPTDDDAATEAAAIDQLRTDYRERTHP